jgi:hypothetical protein
MVRDSIALNWRPNPRVVIAFTALLAVLFYLFVSALIFRVGFPLDDTWIHLTYARNLAEHGEWAFRLGEASAGSTAPLWTFLLAIGFFLKLAPYIWTYFLGWVALTLLGIHAEETARKLLVSYQSKFPWVGLFFVTAWHLTWSAVSGMETLLHGYLIFVTLSMLISGSRRYLALGLLAGASIWVRPDGLTLLGPILLTAILTEQSVPSRKNALVKILIGFGALLVPYLLFNLALSGNPMPNTFYAKQAEYQEYWLSKTLAERSIDYMWPILASPFLVLIPGAFIWINRAMRTRNWGAIVGVIWFFGYIAIYFMRLPAYQHGRYIIPALPILYLWGVVGMIEYGFSPRAGRRLVFLWQTLLATLCVVFGLIAARQNAYDVYWIETEMVGTATWVRENIRPDALLAVHDIGALGYYVDNPILDLAGLISPDVVPFLRDPVQLTAYLDANSADYLIVFLDQYPELVLQKPLVFTSESKSDPIQFHNPMQVYQWRK